MILVFGLCFMVFSLYFCIVYLVLQPKGRVSCASFGSYSDIPSNWASMTPWLDRNHNGIPCESLYKHSH